MALADDLQIKISLVKKVKDKINIYRRDAAFVDWVLTSFPDEEDKTDLNHLTDGHILYYLQQMDYLIDLRNEN